MELPSRGNLNRRSKSGSEPRHILIGSEPSRGHYILAIATTFYAVLEVYDNQGARVYMSRALRKRAIDISTQKPRMYLARLQNENGLQV